MLVAETLRLRLLGGGGGEGADADHEGQSGGEQSQGMASSHVHPIWWGRGGTRRVRVVRVARKGRVLRMLAAACDSKAAAG
ncbi:hypothetical protein GCM10009819_31100 [Agromyces tropicus]|uniref:Uncharacterized protein n=1 Tax=Agromyces tropicus TaxID=555371 RepID=A0ABN2URY1_9MICO